MKLLFLSALLDSNSTPLPGNGTEKLHNKSPKYESILYKTVKYTVSKCEHVASLHPLVAQQHNKHSNRRRMSLLTASASE